MEPVVPDYGGACVTRVVPGLLTDESPPWMPAPIRGADAVVLLALDGLGWNALEAYRGVMPELAVFEGGPITTVVPSTTAAALTSLATGLAPTEHGLVGFRMRAADGVLNVLTWQFSGPGRAPEPFDVQRHTAFCNREVPVVTCSEFRGTPFTDAQLRGARFVGWRTTGTLVEHCRRLVARGEPFVDAYYPGIDKVAHEFGLEDGFYEAELRSADALVGAVRDALPPEAVLVVTSDHGQVHAEADHWIEVGDLDPHVALQAGDARFRYLYARPGAATELAAAARELIGDRAWVLTRRELIDAGWLGPPPAGSIGSRIGDVVLAAHDKVAFVDPALPREAQLRSLHGSLTADEMLVPLLAARGRG